MRTKWSDLWQFVRNDIVHHMKAWLPYGAILLFLAGVWFLWDESGSMQQEPVREAKTYDTSSPPVLSKEKPERGKAGQAGREVYSLAGTRRYKPLADLFSDTSPGRQQAEGKKENEERPASQKQASLTAADKPKQPGPLLPEICGVIKRGDERLIILSDGRESRACAAGEVFQQYRIEYIVPGVAGFSRDGMTYECYY